MSADTIVIGGGIVGLSVAYELARRGRRPTLVERGRRGGEASWAAAGMLAPISEVELEDEVLLELAQDSLGRYPGFVSELERTSGASCRFRSEGTLWVALNRDQLLEIERLQESMLLRALAVRRLDAAELREREPHLSGRVVGGLLVERDLQVDPRALVACLERALERLGGTLLRGVEASAVEVRAPRRLAVQLVRAGERSELVGSCVVVCTGAFMADSPKLPIEPLGVRPVKGQLVRLGGETLLRHVIRNPECYLVPREDGELLLGATMEEQGFDAAPTAGAVLDLLRHAWNLLPALYDLELREVSVGLRPAVVDHLPVIGETEVPGLFVANGHFRHGVLLSPATAHHLAERIVTGRTPEALRPFAPGRLGAPRVAS